MKIIRNLDHYSKKNKNFSDMILTIGNFDGVHSGHRKLIGYLVKLAKRYQLVASVMFFYPHTKSLYPISSLREKLALLGELGIEQVFVLNFNQIKSLPAELFVAKIINELGTKILITGKDFCFGRGRSGDATLLKIIFQDNNLKYYSLPSYDGISSSRIRELLVSSELEQANELLTTPYHIVGKVVTGNSLARTLGFPTANIRANKHIPFSGVFASRIEVDNQVYLGATNIGFTPTTPSRHQKIETHIFDFDGNLYGKYVKLELLQKIREEQKFASLSDLQIQIAKDIEDIKKK